MSSEAAVGAGVSKAEMIGLKMEALKEFIMEHVLDSHTFTVSVPFTNMHYGIPLPSWLSVHGVMLLFACALVLWVVMLARRNKSNVPHGWANALEMFVLFVRDEISIPFLGEKDGRMFTPLFCTFFSLIMVMNLSGLVPCFFTATSNFSITLALAGVTFFFMLFGSMYRNGVLGFFKGFIPHGVPGPVLVLVFPLEIVSFFIKAGALAIRLFANMVAGHMLIFCMLGLVFVYGFFALPITVIVFFIYVMEVFIALLQAYIFTLLSAIFIGQSYHPSH